MRRHLFVPAFVVMFLSGCVSSDPVEDIFSDKMLQLDATGKPLPAAPHSGSSLLASNGNSSTFNGVAQYGTGTFVSHRPPVSKEPREVGGDGYQLNLVDAPISSAAKSILGDILNVPYVVDPRVSGKVTLQTSQPVSSDTLVDILESALTVNGAVIVKKAGSYQIVPANDAFATTPSVSVPSVSSAGPGVKVQVIELQYISAEEMRSILEPISRPGSVLRADSTRNLLVIAGSNSDLMSMRDAIATFDLDWMRGMSVALHPLKASQPVAVAKELNTIFATQDGPGSKLIKFVPNERLNAVLVITSRKTYLSQAAAWIAKLDRLASTNEQQLFVYNIQNRPAKELAQVLQSVVYGDQKSSVTSKTNPVSPDMEPVSLATGLAPIDESMEAAAFDQFSGKTNTQPSIVADTENNALLISTTLREYERIEKILKQLDVMPTQILIEAVIAEVSLTDQLKFGLRWFFESGNFGVGLSDLASGGTNASFPGFAWTFSTSDVGVTLNALSSVTDVNIVSAPTLMALNNQKATLQVGDQVPVVTQQSASTSSSNTAIVNSIELKDTGVILTVVPRVNTSGRVMLDIQQEVSNVVRTTTSGIDSPTIQQRKLSTRVIVGDNESLALGGLIQQRNTINRSQVPVLGKIPLFGNAFKNKEDSINKTELIIFIKPRIVRDVRQAREVTEEFRQQLNFGSSIQKSRGGRNEVEQDLRRLTY
jgi:general secretion pathway protein D